MTTITQSMEIVCDTTVEYELMLAKVVVWAEGNSIPSINTQTNNADTKTIYILFNPTGQ